MLEAPLMASARGQIAGASRPVPRYADFVLAAAATGLSLWRGWYMDDAYITFRVVDNFIHGYGLTWNVAERVQAFTNTLWMFVLIPFAALTREFFLTVYGIQALCTFAASYTIARHFARDLPSKLLVLAALATSRAFIDYSSSGLENALAHLLVALYLVRVLTHPPARERVQGEVALVALLLLTRLDLVFLVGPIQAARLVELVRATPRERASARSVLVACLRGASPLLLWEAFSAFYFGALIPTSARAKLGLGLAPLAQVRHGLAYVDNMLQYDQVTSLVIAAAVVATAVSRRRALRPVAVGLLLHLAYVVGVGGDHMGGRFFSVPFVVAVACVAQAARGRSAYVAAGAAIVSAALGHFATFSDGYFEYTPKIDGSFVWDYYQSNIAATGLRTRPAGKLEPTHPWVNKGREYQRTGTAFAVEGGVGLTGFYAGPHTHILDQFGLTDPLLARLPLQDGRHNWENWAPGHAGRPVPDGYVESLRSGENRVENPALHRYYEALRVITRAPLFSRERLATLARFLAGGFDADRAAYLTYYESKTASEGDIPPRQLVAREARAGYRFDQPGATWGVRFTNTGVRVALLGALSQRRIRTSLDPGTYAVGFWTRSVPACELALVATGGTDEWEVPACAAGATAISFRETSGREWSQLRSLERLP